MPFPKRDWLLYSDRADHAPDRTGMVQTFGFSSVTHESDESPEWRREEWSVRAALVPLDQVPSSQEPAITQAARSEGAHDEIDFRPWWRYEDEFDFGEVRYINGVMAWPWLHHWSHRLDSDRLVIVPRGDFLRYHALDKRKVAGKPSAAEYVQPLDQTVVLRTEARSIEYFNPMPFAEVQLDYLSDYLAARRCAMLLAVVADRFAHAKAAKELGVEDVELQPIGPNAWITTTIHEESPHNRELAMGRVSLYWNIVLSGYDAPKTARNPWSLGGKPAASEGLPTFIANSEGTRMRADDRACPRYLCFSPRVLARYLSTEGFSAGFHMRTWGGVSTPRGGIDVGLNAVGLLNAFMPDIAKLPVAEQQHWSLHSVLPDGGVCEAMFETRMQQRPPNLPSAIEIVAEAARRLQEVLRKKHSVELFKIELAESPPRSGAMSIGPLGTDFSEVAELAVPLYAWIVESMQVAPLRAVLESASASYDEKARQIVLLRSILTEVAGLEAADARLLTDPLTALNELRVKAAHVSAPDIERAGNLVGMRYPPANARELWDALIDSVAKSLAEIAQRIEGAATT